MHRAFLLCLTFYLIQACSDDGNSKPELVKSDMALAKISGQVYSIEEIPFRVDSNGKIVDTDSAYTITDYDTLGNIKSRTIRKSSGAIIEETFFERYENGMWKSSRTKKEGQTAGSAETTINRKWQYTDKLVYDETGKKIRSYSDITQNENGQILSWKLFNKDSIFSEEIIYTYDSLFLKTETLIKDMDGNAKSRTSYIYNEKGELTEQTKTENLGGVAEITVTRYTYDTHDENGNWTQRTAWNDQGKALQVVKRTYSYRS